MFGKLEEYTHTWKRVSRVVRVVIYEYVFFAFSYFLCPCFWQIMTSSAKDHQPNKVDYTFYSSMRRNKEQKQKCVL